MAGPVEALYEQMRQAMPASAGGVTAVPTQVASRIRVLALRTPTLPPAAHTNAYLVGPLDGPVAVIDPGSPYPEEQAALDAALAELEISLILLTHHHGDHIGGAVALAARTGAPIAAHRETAQLLDGVVPINRFVDEGEVIVVGDTPITAIHTPGHAVGHLCFEHAGSTVAGDMVAGLGTILIDPSEGDMAHYLASLELLLGRPPGTLLPAHGPPIVDGHGK
ncbi:MAG: MBL fold metallo-hydrolase, partial [Deltaproteobacteria bacterium]|nr:MBL fold metallo-hydrolase [Deltaproteobacteria bacterium]